MIALIVIYIVGNEICIFVLREIIAQIAIHRLNLTSIIAHRNTAWERDVTCIIIRFYSDFRDISILWQNGIAGEVLQLDAELLAVFLHVSALVVLTTDIVGNGSIQCPSVFLQFRKWNRKYIIFVSNCNNTIKSVSTCTPRCHILIVDCRCIHTQICNRSCALWHFGIDQPDGDQIFLRCHIKIHTIFLVISCIINGYISSASIRILIFTPVFRCTICSLDITLCRFKQLDSIC